MAVARKDLVPEDEVVLVHAIGRCVRRAWLCGEDPYTGKNFEHRRVWFQDRIKLLSGSFMVDVYAYAVMSNHVHLVMRVDPVRAGQLSDLEVVERWWRLFPKERDASGEAAEMSEVWREQLLRDTELIKVWRKRLGNLSWFMRSLNEFIARRANREDDCTGRFWEGRFTSQRLADEGALLACMAYVDLNPVRAAIAENPEHSEFTSAYDRIHARQAREKLAKSEIEASDLSSCSEAQKRAFESARELSSRDSWLVPLTRNGDEQGKTFGQLNVALDEYLQLLDETGRMIREGKTGSISTELAPILERLELDQSRWVENVKRYGSLYHHIAGKLENIASAAQSAGKKWFCVKSRAGRDEVYTASPRVVSV